MMKKVMLNLCLGAMALLMASCGSGGSAVLDGYDFSGDGILGKIPMGLAIQYGTMLEVNQELEKKFEDKIGQKSLLQMDKGDVEKFRQMLNEAQEKFSHCLDDMQDDLKADSARLLALKGINWENKTAANIKLAEVRFGDKDKVYGLEKNRDILILFDATKDKVAALPNGRLHFLVFDKKGKQVSERFWHSAGKVDLQGVVFHTSSLAESRNLKGCKTKEEFEKAVDYCMSLDSIDKILLLDDDQILDYRSSTMSLTGVGPIRIGMDMDSIPERVKDIYTTRTEIINPEAEIYSFGYGEDYTYFTGIGGPDGKLKSIEVENECIPLKVGDMVLRVGDTYSKIVEKYGKKISWSYNPDNMEIKASLEGGKVTFDIYHSNFSAAGLAKYEQMENGAKNIVFTSSDFDPEAKLELFVVQ